MKFKRRKMRGVRELGGLVLLLWGLTGTASAQDLTQISELERLREQIQVLQRLRENEEVDIAVYRAYIRKLEGRIQELGIRLGLEERVQKEREASQTNVPWEGEP